MGFVMSWVRAPAASEAAKKSAGERRCCWWWAAGWGVGRRRWAMARSMPDLKKKKDAQLVALPSRFGVRPR